VEISAVAISNLYSFASARLGFEDFNVVVGYNVAGKTNLVRILKILAGYQDRQEKEGYIPLSFDSIALSRELRFDQTKSSTLVVELLLSYDEIRIILQFLMKRPITWERHNLNYDFLKKIDLAIYWPSTPNEYQEPEFVLIRFANNFTIWRHKNQNRVGFIENLPSTSVELKNLFSGFSKINSQTESNIYRTLGFTYEKWLDESRVQDAFLEGSSLGLLANLIPPNNYMHYDNLDLTYSPSQPRSYIAEIYEFCHLSKEHPMTLWLLISCMMKKNVIFLEEIRISHDLLATRLKGFAETDEETWRYDEVKSAFKMMFNDVNFRILRKQKQQEQQEKGYYIQIEESPQRKYRLENSASGYYETLILFSELASKEDSILVLDEPALHFHPTKIKYLRRRFMEMARRQIILITHSPYFADVDLFSPGRNLLYIKRNNTTGSMVFGKPLDLQLDIAPYLFKPDIFFSKCSIFVEGAGDASSLVAISDALGSIFEKNDIFVVDSGGKGNIENYNQIITSYEINYIAMVDHDYEGWRTQDFTILPGKLENELNGLGWNGDAAGSIDPQVAYDFIFKKMQNDSEERLVKQSRLGTVFNAALRKIGENPDSIW
jgi:AAA15 family ATPase/GTPase